MTGGFEFGIDDADTPTTATEPDDSEAPAEPNTGDGADYGGASSGASNGFSDDIDAEQGEPELDPELAALLYDGETVTASVPLDDGRLVRTTHRVLVHMPDTAGRTLAVVQGPNVEGVSISASGRGVYVSPALKSLLVGAILVVAGAMVPVDGMADVAPSGSGAGATGMGGTVALLADLLGAIALLDDALSTLGAFVLLVGVALLGLYLRSRTREVVVSVAGDDDLTLPASDVAEADVARVATEP